MLFFIYYFFCFSFAIAAIAVVVFGGGVDSVFGVNERIFDCVYECIGYLIDDDNDKLLNVFFCWWKCCFWGCKCCIDAYLMMMIHCALGCD